MAGVLKGLVKKATQAAKKAAKADEAVEKVTYLLDHEDEREEIARAGQKRTLKDHTIFNRCQLIDNVIQSKL